MFDAALIFKISSLNAAFVALKKNDFYVFNAYGKTRNFEFRCRISLQGVTVILKNFALGQQLPEPTTSLGNLLVI